VKDEIFRSTCPSSLVGLLDANKYKMLMRIPLDDLEVMKGIVKYRIHNEVLFRRN